MSLRDCARDCLACYDACISTAYGHCLAVGGEHIAAEHFRLMRDCAEICRTSADFLLRESTLHPLTCGVCAEICTRCADDCARFDDAHMRRCAEACRSCAESCRMMTQTRSSRRAGE
jgi:hypothetical protein